MPSNTRKKRKNSPVLLRRLCKHFGTEPADLPVVEQQFGLHERPNLHLALAEILGELSRPSELLGILAHQLHDSPSLARLSRESVARGFEPGPVEYHDVPLPGGQHLACVKTGLYLIPAEEGPLALMVSMPRYAHPPHLLVEVMAGEREQAEHFLRLLQRRTHHGQAYRGHVLSLKENCYGAIEISYHPRRRFAARKSSCPNRSCGGSNGTRSVSPSTPSACVRPAGT